MAQNPNPSLLDQNQILQRVFDEANDQLRVEATVSASIGEVKITDGAIDASITTVASKNGLDVNVLNDLIVDINHTDDSVSLGDGTSLITSTNVGGKQGLDVNVIDNLDASTDNVSISDGTDTLQINSDGSLNVNTTPYTNSDAIYEFNEITGIASGIETTIVTYSANAAADCFLQCVEIYGTNIAEYRFYKNATLVNKKYTSFTEFGGLSDYRTENSICPGLKLTSPDTFTIKVLHSRPSVGNFNARIQILELS